MGTDPSGLLELIRELRRRSVLRVGAVYVVSVWAAVEVAVGVFPHIGLPPWAVTLVIALAVLGFPVVLLVAWAFQVTPEGIRREAPPPGGENAPASAAAAPTVRPAGTPTRFIALPLRVLRPDPETDFLAESLPDAVGCALSGLGSLSVRSAVGVRTADPDETAALLRRAEVDVVLTGSLLRAGDQLRVNTQLTELPSGTLRWSRTLQVPLHDLFLLQDELTQAIVESLALPLTARETGLLQHDVPTSAAAYEAYLRANHLGLELRRSGEARDLYLEAVRLDPGYAPAWARLGRCHRVVSKYSLDPATAKEARARAEEALRRALALNPELPIAHRLYAQLEVEAGLTTGAVLRLLARARVNGADAEIFSGLVHACRYGGLLEASLAAHRRTLQLDPSVPTSVEHTYFMLGDFEHSLAEDIRPVGGFMHGHALASLHREREALEVVRERERSNAGSLLGVLTGSLRAFLEGRRNDGVKGSERALAVLSDGEGVFYVARQLAHFGEPERALDALARAVELGFFCPIALERDPWLAPLRGGERFRAIERRATDGHLEAAGAFHTAGGGALLGPPARSAAVPVPLPSAGPA